jgi:hypothetical protein
MDRDAKAQAEDSKRSAPGASAGAPTAPSADKADHKAAAGAGASRPPARERVQVLSGTLKLILFKHGHGRNLGKGEFSGAMSGEPALEQLLAQAMAQEEIGRVPDAYGNYHTLHLAGQVIGKGRYPSGDMVETRLLRVVTSSARDQEGNRVHTLVTAFPLPESHGRAEGMVIPD